MNTTAGCHLLPSRALVAGWPSSFSARVASHVYPQMGGVNQSVAPNRWKALEVLSDMSSHTSSSQDVKGEDQHCDDQ